MAPFPRRRRSISARTSSLVMRPADSRPRDLGGLQAVLTEKAAHHRREELPTVVGRGRGAERLGGGRSHLSAGDRDGLRGWRCRRGWRSRRRRRRNGGRRRRSGGNRSRWGRCRRRSRCHGGGLGRGRRGRRSRPVGDDCQPGTHLDRLPLAHEDLGEDPGGRRGDLGVDLVRRHLEEGFVSGDRVTDRLIHRVMVPSVTVSPSWGMVTSANVQSPSGQCQHRLAEGLRERGVRLDELRRPRRAWPPS